MEYETGRGKQSFLGDGFCCFFFLFCFVLFCFVFSVANIYAILGWSIRKGLKWVCPHPLPPEFVYYEKEHFKTKNENTKQSKVAAHQQSLMNKSVNYHNLANCKISILTVEFFAK